MKTKLFLVGIITILIYGNCGKSNSSAPNPPTSSFVAPTMGVTTAASAITSTTALSGGNVISDGGATVTARGVCWSLSANPTTANFKTADGTGTGAFNSNLTGLIANTLYYARAYAINSAGTSYGSEITFTTQAIVAIPTVGTTTAISTITNTSAVSGGIIISDGGASLTARGVCWSTSANPTLADFKTTDGTAIGTFTSKLTGLTSNTLYYVRCYATNSIGTAYGSEISFTTTQDLIVTICGQVWMTRNLDVSTYKNGDAIPQVTDELAWKNLTTGAWCYYNNDPATGAIYGKLYNWYAVNDPRGLAPAGFHVPSSAEWTVLANCLGGESVAGGKLKETGTAHWDAPNTGATNSSGFSALGGGVRSDWGVFNSLGNYCYWYTSTLSNPGSAASCTMYHNQAILSAASIGVSDGFYVRCVKD